MKDAKGHGSEARGVAAHQTGVNEVPTESWRFNRGEWQAKIVKMTDAELHKEHIHHLNYVPSSPVVHLTMAELKKRKLGY